MQSVRLAPDVIIIVATVRALKVHGGGPEVKAGAPLAPEYTPRKCGIVACRLLELAKLTSQRKRYTVCLLLLPSNKMSSDTDKEHDVIREEALESRCF